MLDNRHKLFYIGSYLFWFMSHTFLLCVTAGESWVVLNNPTGSDISDTSPFHKNNFGQVGTAVLLCLCVIVSSAGLLADKFVSLEKFGRAKANTISISLILVGVLLLTAMSIYTSSYSSDMTNWGWSYGLGWATVWFYFVCGVGYYFGFDPDA